MIASVWVTRFLEEEIVACFFKTQVLDVMAEAVSQKHSPERLIWKKKRVPSWVPKTHPTWMFIWVHPNKKFKSWTCFGFQNLLFRRTYVSLAEYWVGQRWHRDYGWRPGGFCAREGWELWMLNCCKLGANFANFCPALSSSSLFKP